MAWIESHQSLAQHPKTIRLARELHCGIPAAVGYLHLLWWWALDYAPVGTVYPPRRDDAIRACHWSRDASRFWAAMVSAGFIDEMPDGTLKIHDWFEYAGRLLERRQKDAARKRAVRGMSAGRPEPRPRPSGVQNQPTNHVVVGVEEAPGPRAHEPGPDGPLARSEPDRLPNGAQECPLCPEIFTGTYDEHLSTSPRHKVREKPETFGRKGSDELLPEVGSALPGGIDINALHEQLLAQERGRQ